MEYKLGIAGFPGKPGESIDKDIPYIMPKEDSPWLSQIIVGYPANMPKQESESRIISGDLIIYKKKSSFVWDRQDGAIELSGRLCELTEKNLETLAETLAKEVSQTAVVGNTSLGLSKEIYEEIRKLAQIQAEFVQKEYVKSAFLPRKPEFTGPFNN